MNPRVLGIVGCATAQTLLGASFVVTRSVVDYPTLTGQTVRYVLAAAVLVPLAVARVPSARRPSARELVRLAGISLSGLVGFNIVLMAALRHADAPAVGTVVGISPLILAVAGPLLVGARPSPRLFGAAVLVVAGAAVVEGCGHTDPKGLLFALATLAGEVLFSLFAVSLLDRFTALGVSAWTCLLAVPTFAVAAVVCGELSSLRAPTWHEVWALGYLGFLLTVVAFLAWYTGLHRLGAATAGMFVGLLPVVSMVTAVLFDEVVPSPSRMAGVIVVGVGISLGLRAERGTSPRPTSSSHHQHRTPLAERLDQASGT